MPARRSNKVSFVIDHLRVRGMANHILSRIDAIAIAVRMPPLWRVHVPRAVYDEMLGAANS